MKFAGSIAIAVAVVASIAQADAKTKSVKVSTVTSYQVSGMGIQCNGKCFPSGAKHVWKCPTDNSGAIPVCHLDCNARPPSPIGGCLAM